MIKVIIIDDEKLAIDNLHNILKKIGNIEVSATFLDPIEALKCLENYDVDVIFLDIDLPRINGMQLAERIIEIKNNVNIVFVTAFNEYAVDAFELNALDYLLKPITESRLKKTVDRICGVKKMNPNGLNIFCFGNFRVTYQIENKEQTLKFRTNKAEELLELLIINCKKAISSDYIIEYLWPDFDLKKAMVNLYTSVHYLRKAFKNIGIDDIVKNNKGNYFINTDKMNCDLYKFQNIVEKNKKNNANIEQLEEARNLYSDNLLQEKDYLWVENIRNKLSFDYIDILKTLYKIYVDQKNYKAAEAVMLEALKIEPLSESLSKDLIHIYLLLGDRFAAIKYYEKYKKLLKEELGIELDIDLKDLIWKKI